MRNFLLIEEKEESFTMAQCWVCTIEADSLESAIESAQPN